MFSDASSSSPRIDKRTRRNKAELTRGAERNFLAALCMTCREYMTRHCRRDCNSFRQKEQLNIVGWYAAMFQFGLTNVFRRASIMSGWARGRGAEFLAFVKIASVHSSCCLPCRLVVTSAGNADEILFYYRARKNARVTRAGMRIAMGATRNEN